MNNKVSLIAYLIANGIAVPHYCYHNDLSIAGNCRVCLVELKNSMKPVVSCATNARAVLQSSNVYYDSALIKKARENILEFLLVNHPLDCPICDQGGDCDLQDQSLFFGSTKRRFYKFKRVVCDKELGPIVKTVMTRCIHCTRCARFAAEIAGTTEIGMFGRGGSSEIGTYVKKILTTELSGNIIDLCPVGALTLKSFPFELRGWDIEKFNSIDLTDGFACSTKVYINKQQIIQIEPDHSKATSNGWLSDKGRQFFDGIFNTWQSKNLFLKKKSWQKNIRTLLKTIYLFEHCNAKDKSAYFFTIVFQNLGLETLSLLKILEQKYSFIKLRKPETVNIINDLESTFQLNSAVDLDKLKTSTLCLLVANNPRYEGYHLNISLRQRYLKGNFKCLVLGSQIDLTFPTITIGTNLTILKKIAEGNNFICQDIKTSKNPLLIFGNEFQKITNIKRILEMLNTFPNLSKLSRFWNGLNTLNSTLCEVGTQSLAHFLTLKKKDFNQSNAFYFINVNAQNFSSLEKITEAKLLNYNTFSKKNLYKIKQLFFDQNSYVKNNQTFAQHLLKSKNNEKYVFLPLKIFYENKETFINTEGLFKKTSKLLTRRQARDGWKLLRNLMQNFKNKYIFFNPKDNHTLSFSATKQNNFTSFMNLHYSATEELSNSARLIAKQQNQPFFIEQSDFKQRTSKIKNTKTKYWLDDFFTGGKDEHSKNSTILSKCSGILRKQSSNFL